jgi:hypothetical protein
MMNFNRYLPVNMSRIMEMGILWGTKNRFERLRKYFWVRTRLCSVERHSRPEISPRGPDLPKLEDSNYVPYS